MQALEDAIDSMAQDTGFSGVVRVDRSGSIELAKAYGSADRGHEISNTIDTQFGIASGTKGLTALSVVSLIEEGSLDLTTTARSVLGGDLPLIDDGVTIERLLSHRSGIGDYLDEEAVDDVTDYLMRFPCRISRRPSSTSRSWAATTPPSRRGRSSSTATAATSCSR